MHLSALRGKKKKTATCSVDGSTVEVSAISTTSQTKQSMYAVSFRFCIALIFDVLLLIYFEVSAQQQDGLL